MRRTLSLLALLPLLLAGPAPAREEGFTPLFNGKDFSGWKRFLDPKAKDADPDKTWTISDGVIHCTGKPMGYLLTEKEYENYVLRVQWRFGEKPGNSGVFVHVSGPDKIWPKGVEAQLMSGQAGDFWLVDGFQLTVDKERQDPGTPRHYLRFGETWKKEGTKNVAVRKNVEKPLGEWNQYEITCQGDTIKLVVNGQEVNVGTKAEATKGKILLQSEGAEIHFRNIELKPLK